MILVVKLSGKALESQNLRRSLAGQLKRLLTSGHQFAVVHGAGRQLTTLSAELGIPVVQYEGRRVTDERTIQAAKMAFAAVNRDLVADLVAAGVPAVGMAGYDAGLTTARRRGPVPVAVSPGDVRDVDFGFVGDILTVNTGVLRRLFDAGLLPVICSLCSDDSGVILNINADTLAAEIAKAMRADRLVSVSDVEGIYQDPGDPSTLLRRVSVDQARSHMVDGTFSGGMIPKVRAALEVVEGGVAAFQIVSGLTENGLVEGVESDTGTLITR